MIEALKQSHWSNCRCYSKSITYEQGYIFRCLHKIVRSDYYLLNDGLPVRPHGTAELPLDEILW